jgi:hypothetical protein
MRRILFVVIAFCMSACQAEDRSASYVEASGAVSISLELFHMHPFLAEYERELVLLQDGKELKRKRLFPDTGGYTETNLYKCSNSQYLVKGYFDSWIVNIDNSSIIEGRCEKEQPMFIGAFHGAGSKPWIFSPASERDEQLLEPKGG